MTLKKRLFIIITSIISVALIASFILAHYLVNSFAQKYFQRKLEFLIKQTTQNLSLPILLNDKELAEKIIRQILSEPEIIGIKVLRQNEKIWIKEGKVDIGEPIIREIRLLTPEEEVLFPEKSNIIGKIEIYIDDKRFQRAIQKFFTIFAIMAMTIATLTGITVYIVIYRTIAKPLEELLIAARKVSEGNLAIEVTGKGLPETQELAIAFNEMLKSLKAHQKRLQKAYQNMAEHRFWAELGRFSTIVAHEIKNPLGIIQGSVDLLKKETLSPQERLRLISFIEDEVRRLDNLVKNFLFYARPIKPNFKRISLALFLEGLKQKIKLYFGVEDIELQLDEKDIGMETDPDLLFHALYNILKNAFEAGATKVKITVSKDKETVKFVICDNGPGIPVEKRERIFEPFYTTKTKGSGLGLSVVKRVVEILKGKVEVKSCTHLNGAEFTLFLPTGRDGITPYPP